MCARSNKSSKKKPVDRPFAAAALDRARKLVDHYQVILEFEDGEWVGHGLELPRVFADGATPGQCVDQVRQAMIGAAAMMIEDGQSPPAPAREGRRTEQINVRVSREEKLRLEHAAQQRGFKGLSDYLRSMALDRAG